jgi:sigma-B regulation protein RsbU (phosphoserine phosphatase)
MSLSSSLLRAFAEQHRPLIWLDSLSGELPPEEVQKRMKRQRMLLSGGTSALLAAELTNTYICENHGDMNMFATLFFGVLDPATGTLTYVNGGHDSPIIFDS